VASLYPFAAADAPDVLTELARAPIEDVLLPVLVQLVVIILAARLFAVVFRRLGQPGVVGEIAAGLVLGPSVLGWLFPGVWRAVFHPAVAGLPPEASDAVLHWIFTILSQLGLVFLLFLIGLEADFSHLRWHGASALGISAAGIVLPFALGLAVAPLILPHLEGPPLPPWSFALFLGTALSITAIPVLGRIMMELNITRTRVGAITLSAAAVDDAAGWILLATVAAVARVEKFREAFDPWAAPLMLAETLAFTLVMILVARPVLRWAVRRTLRRNHGELSVNALAVLLAVIFACAIATNVIGIFAVFGAFCLGAVLSGEHEFRRAVAGRLRDVVTAFLLPIFFTYTGLRTDVGSLGGSMVLWLLCGLVFLAAVLGKLGGAGLAAWLGRFPPREAACIGALMNTRGLMALIVINLGRDLGVVPPAVYCMLVLMALATTAMTTPLVLRLMPGTELEPYVRRSGFLSGTPRAAATTAEPALTPGPGDDT
jgi:Kef-type K+ transport system membrane component KefB